MMPESAPPSSPQLTVEAMQRVVDSWISSTGAGYFSHLTNMAMLTEEVGEVAKIMARRYGDQVAKPGDKSNLADELADVMWVVCAIANQTGIDLTEAFANNLAKKNIRDKERFGTKEQKENSNKTKINK